MNTTNENPFFPVHQVEISTCEKCGKTFNHLADEKTRYCMGCTIEQLTDKGKIDGDLL